MYDHYARRAYAFEYLAYGAGWVIGPSVQGEVGLAWGPDPVAFTGKSSFGAADAVPGGVGAGGQYSWSGEISMYTAGVHVGIPGGSAVGGRSYTWYRGEADYYGTGANEIFK